MTDEDRDTMNKAGVGIVGVSAIGLGATYACLAYDHRNIAAGTIIGTAVIDLILGGIVIYEKAKDRAPCADPAPSYTGPTYLPPCHQ